MCFLHFVRSVVVTVCILGFGYIGKDQEPARNLSVDLHTTLSAIVEYE